ncbi:hypothetical protein [Micromonospora sp. NPDC005206]|uniref:hypothetical protein n=1 Tax=Micromonospora sp. NPDC005206 TaxID=3157022 RepID=UPI0033A491C0
MRRPAARWAVLALLAVLASGGGVVAHAHPGSPRTHSASETAAGGRATAELALAAWVVARLTESGLPISDPVVCTRPASNPDPEVPPPMVAFRDRRVERSYPRPVVAAGGAVEVFASEAEVADRLALLEEQTIAAQRNGFDEMGRALHPERRYQAGPVLLRLTGFLPPQAAERYRTVFEQAVADGATSDDIPEEVPCSI